MAEVRKINWMLLMLPVPLPWLLIRIPIPILFLFWLLLSGPLEMQMQMKCLHQVRGGAEIMPLFRFVQTPPDKSRTTEDYGMQCGLRPELLWKRVQNCSLFKLIKSLKTHNEITQTGRGQADIQIRKRIWPVYMQIAGQTWGKLNFLFDFWPARKFIW